MATKRWWSLESHSFHETNSRFFVDLATARATKPGVQLFWHAWCVGAGEPGKGWCCENRQNPKCPQEEDISFPKKKLLESSTKRLLRDASMKQKPPKSTRPRPGAFAPPLQPGQALVQSPAGAHLGREVETLELVEVQIYTSQDPQRDAFWWVLCRPKSFIKHTFGGPGLCSGSMFEIRFWSSASKDSPSGVVELADRVCVVLVAVCSRWWWLVSRCWALQWLHPQRGARQFSWLGEHFSVSKNKAPCNP